MTEGTSVLRRKAEAGRTSVAASRQITPCKSLSTAFIQAFDRRLELEAQVSACTLRTGTLAELLEMLPDGGLIAVLEGPGEAQGLMVFDAGLLSAVIEKMMMGRLAARQPQPRRPTRTDAALSADLVDDVLRRLEAPFLTDRAARWISGFGYASYLDDPRPLGLMMEDVDYSMFSLAGEVDNGARAVRLMIALPSHPADRVGGGDGGPGAPAPPSIDAGDGAAPDAEDLPWSDAFEARVLPSRTTVHSVLHRFPMSISALEALRPGDELPIPGSALETAELIGADGGRLCDGRLGQSRGRRAVRLAGSELSSEGVASRVSGGEHQGLPPTPLPTSSAETSDLTDGTPMRDADHTAIPSALPPLPDAPALGDFADPPPPLPDLSDLPDPAELPPLDSLPKL